MTNLSHIVQKYLGMKPKDLGCTDWTEMQSKMEEEINAFLQEEASKPTPDPVYINGKYGHIVDELTVTLIQLEGEDAAQAYAYLNGWSIFSIDDIDEMRPLTADELEARDVAE